MEEMAPQQTTPLTQKLWFRYGLIGGIAGIVLMAIIYIIDVTLLMEPIAYIVYAAILAAGIVAAIQRKAQQNGYLRYGESVVTMISTFMFAFLLVTVFNILLFTVIDTSLVDIMRETQISKLGELYDQEDISKDMYDQQVRLIESAGTGMYLFGAFMSFIIIGILALIIYLIASIIVRNEPK